MNKSGGIPGGLVGVLHPPICRQVYPVTFSSSQSSFDGSLHTSKDTQLYKSFLDSPFSKNSQSAIVDDIDEIFDSSILNDASNRTDSKVRHVRPPAQKQLANVQLLLSNVTHNTNVSMENKLFFLDSDWFSNWYEYVTASKASEIRTEPGTIDNRSIAADELVDAVALPEDVWTALVSWYSGGPPINQLSANKTFQLLTNREVLEKYYPLLLVLSSGEDTSGKSHAKTKALSSTNASNFCFICHAKSSMRCGKCSQVFYCTKDCQLIHWRLQHKFLCGKPSGNVCQQVGLFNLGNSCYMSSSLQCLAHIRPLTRFFLSQQHIRDLNRESKYGTAGRLVDQYVKLMEEMFLSYSGKVISPRAFKVALGKVNIDYAGLVQQDAHELVQLLLDKLHEDLNRVRGAKPSTVRSEGDGTNDTGLAREQWDKTLLRDDSQVNDVAGSLMRCQHVCPSCSKKTVFYEHQNTVALCIPPPPPQVQPIQAPSNLIDIKVVYLPEVPQQTRNFSFASLKQLLQPQVWMVPVNQENSVSVLRERIAKLLPAAALKQCNEKIVLVEASNANRSTVQAKFLDDSTSLASLSPARLVYCYCPIHIYKKRLLLLQRAIVPSEVEGPRTVDQCIKSSLFGFPQLVSYDPDWATARLRLCIWTNQFRSLEEGSAEELNCRESFEEQKVLRQLELASLLPLRLLSRLGTSKGRLQEKGVDTVLMEGPPAAQVLSKVFDGLSSNRIRDLEQLITDYENGVGETKQGDSASVTLQRDFNVEMGQYVPAEKQIKVAQFEQVCLKEGTTLFLAVDWLGGDATALVNKSEQDFQTLLVPPSAPAPTPIPPPSPAAQAYHFPAPISLHDCLKEHTTEEVLDEGNELYCSNCKAHKPVAKVIHFHRDFLPNVLIIILKRFERRQVRSRSRGGSFAGDSLSYMRNMLDNLPQSGVSGGMRTEKIDDLIDFPLDGLNLDPYCSAGGEAGRGDGIYDLFAVCNHYGRAGFGHYTAVCREWKANDELSEQWYCFDDDHVSRVRPSEVRSKAAYILFYRKRLQHNSGGGGGGGGGAANGSADQDGRSPSSK